jgi:hypothetical protein
MAVLESWQERARSIGYFDDDYAASQMWKEDWETLAGDRIAERARAAVQLIEPLRTGPAILSEETPPQANKETP